MNRQFPATDRQDLVDNIISDCWLGNFQSIADLSKHIQEVTGISEHIEDVLTSKEPM